MMLILSVFYACGPQEMLINEEEWSNEVSISGLFSDSMVLQRDADVAVWGWGEAGKYIRVKLAKNVKTLKVDEQGKWMTTFNTPGAGKKDELYIYAKDTIHIKDIIYGDVWICAGQSNMEMPLAGWGRVLNYQQEIASADYPDIRLFRSNNSKIQYAYIPEEKVRTQHAWEICTPEAVENFSAAAYFFARDIFTETGVPIGVLQVTSGGTPVEAWMPGELCENYDDIYNNMSDVIDGDIEKDKAREKESSTAIKEWYAGSEKFDKGLIADLPWYSIEFDDSKWTDIPDLPDGFWYENGFQEIKGVFWYRKKITLSPSVEKQAAFIRLGQIYSMNELYVNGEYIGEFTSGARPSEYDIPAGILKAGENQIAVRIQANRTNGGMRGLPEDFFLAVDKDTVSLCGSWKIAKGFDYKDYSTAPTGLSLKRRPTIIYNALVNPLIPFTMKGMLWYQGESNMNNPEVYGEYITAMIGEYRERWNAEFPFYFVQIANYMKNSPTDRLPWLREAQTSALELPNVYMTTAIDIGSKHDVHPKNKQDVGKRLALQALKNSYGKKIDAQGPVFNKAEVRGSQVLVYFDKAGQLKTKDDKELCGFQIWGETKKWENANARITGSKIIVSHRNVQQPKYVRYAFQNNPKANLTDDSNLPAYPFRTDTFERIKQ
jgi:sialate O-acetylesterase